MERFKRVINFILMEIELAGVWSGVGETAAGLSDREAEAVYARAEAQEKEIRARYQRKD